MTAADWLERAVAKAKTGWLRQLLREYLPQIKDLDGSEEDIAKARAWDALIKQKMVEQGKVLPSQQKNAFSEINNALRTIDPHHPAIGIIGFSKAEWTDINMPTEEKVAARETKFLSDPQAIVDLADTLLGSNEWADLAAGLAVLTGRRCSEILQTAQFAYKTAYSVTFSGAAKRGDEAIPLIFEIPTLTKAHRIVTAVGKLRSWLDTTGMSNVQVNRNYSAAVIRACDRHFAALVPARDGKDNLYTHLFRSVYATVATHWYCPPQVSDLEFRAAIQGHYKILTEENPELRRSLASSRHYYDYRIGDGQGNIDGRVGIKLSEPGVQVLECFQPASQRQPIPESTAGNNSNPFPASAASKSISTHTYIHTHTQMKPRPRLTVRNSFSSYSDDKERWTALLEQMASGASRPDQVAALLDWAEAKLAEELNATIAPLEDVEAEVEAETQKVKVQPAAPSPPPAPDAIAPATETILNELSKAIGSINFLTSQLARQQEERQHFIQENDRLQQHLTHLQAKLEQLEQDNNGLQTELTQLREKEKQFTTLSQLLQTLQLSQATVVDRPSSTAQAPSQPITPQLSLPTQLPIPVVRTRRTPQEASSTAFTTSSEALVEKAIDAIMRFNNQPDLPRKDKWLISISSLKRLTKRNQDLILRVLDRHHESIRQHHEFHQLPQNHNSKGKFAPKIEQVITL
jgi:flagellar motility protein MotE (MotC chaperone)